MEEQQLASIPLVDRTSVQPTVLANFISQRTKLKISTQNIGDYFLINRIIIYSKPIYSEFPR